MRVLVITSEWPTPAHPELVPFIVQEVETLRDLGISVDVFAFRGAKNPLNYAKAWLRLHRTYNLRKYDIIHAHFGQSGLITIGSQTPLVVTFHGSDLEGIVGKDGKYSKMTLIMRAASRFVARRAKASIVVSRHMVRYLPEDTSIYIIPHGIDLKLFKPMCKDGARKKIGLPQDKKIVLFPANPARPVKRFWLAKEALNIVNRKLEVDLITLSNIPHHVVPYYMNASDALLLTSKHEGSPNVVVEALACNLPVVSVDVGDVRERIAHIPGCYVCDKDTPDVIAHALIKVLNASCRISGRGFVIGLDRRAVAQRIINVYHSVMA